MIPELCTTCRFYRRIEDETYGTCHASPPVPTLLGSDDDEDAEPSVAIGVWPLVDAVDFCGEWRPVRVSMATRLRIAADALHGPRRKVRA